MENSFQKNPIHEQKNIENNFPPINYVDIVIDDDYVQKNLLPNGGLYMKGGQANWNGKVDLMRYSISPNLALEYKEIVLEKIEKIHANREKTYHHESHHIKNRDNQLTPHLAAGNLREFLSFRVLDELSAFSAGELYNKESVSLDDVLGALEISAKKIAESYYKYSFPNDASWYLSKHKANPHVFSREINIEKYHQILTQYFKYHNCDILMILQKNNKMQEFTATVNNLIRLLDPILEKSRSN